MSESLQGVWQIFVSHSTVISGWAAIFISIIALSVTFWQLAVQRRHNYLSVQPRLNIHTYELDDWSGLYIVNTGLGEAVLHEFRLEVDDVPQKDWKQALLAIGISDEYGLQWRDFRKTYSVAKETELWLVKLGKDAHNYDSRSIDLQKKLPRITVTVSYNSIYDEKNYKIVRWPVPSRHET